MKKINPKIITLAMLILTALAAGGIATSVTAPGGFEDGDPGTPGG